MPLVTVTVIAIATAQVFAPGRSLGVPVPVLQRAFLAR